MIVFAWLLGCTPNETPDSRIDCDAPTYDDHPAAEALRAFVDDRVARGLPGLAVGVRTPDGVWLGAGGYADLEHDVPLTTCHVHPMASVGKTWHATLAVRLAEAGRLDLDAPIATLLDEEVLRGLPNTDATLRQLMSHRSGLTDFNEHLPYLGFEFDGTRHPNAPETILRWVRGQPPHFATGQGYHYTDTAFVLLALAIEAVTGDLVGAMDQDVHQRLGMTRTTLPREGDADPVGRVNAYWEIGGDRLSNVSGLQAKYDVQVLGAGNVRSTLSDALALIDGVARGPLPSDRARREMQDWNPHSESEDGFAYGLGLSRRTIGETTWVGHTGGDVGAGALILGRPDAELSIVAMTNVGMFLGGPLMDVWNEAMFEALVALVDPTVP